MWSVDIDECATGLNDCIIKKGCSNKQGGYDCVCPKEHSGDGRKNGKGCIDNSSSNRGIKIVLGNFHDITSHFLLQLLIKYVSILEMIASVL